MGPFTADPRGLSVAVVPAFNAEPRRPVSIPKVLVLHYTGMSSGPKAVDWLARAESRVSCHYVVDTDGAITQLVPESYRAWHAGQSFWHGETDLNSASIGIEIQNPGHEHGYPAFATPMVDAVIALSRDICLRQHIAPANVVAHSDIAPGRKIDPGEKFPWAKLASAGVGLWVPPAPLDPADAGDGIGAQGSSVTTCQKLLRAYGYNAPLTGELDRETMVVISAFQRHFRPSRVDGRLDRSTLLTLAGLSAALDRAAPPIA